MTEKHDTTATSAAASGKPDGNDAYLDGNAAAGILSEIFTFDVTVARGRCEHCGAIAVLAAARWYPDSHGLVLSCSLCDGVLLRLVEHDDRRRLDLRGLSFLDVSPR